MTSNELKKILVDAGKSDEEITEIIAKFEAKPIRVRAQKRDFSELLSILNIDNLGEVRYFKFLNISACVVRTDNQTKVSFAFKNPEDFEEGYDPEDDITLTPISPKSDYDSCYYSSMNSKSEKFTAYLDGHRSSYTSVYEAWTYMCRNNLIPAKYKRYNLKIVAFVDL